MSSDAGLEEVEDEGEPEVVYAARVSTRLGTTRGAGEGLDAWRLEGVTGAGRGGPGGGLLDLTGTIIVGGLCPFGWWPFSLARKAMGS